MKKHGWYSYTMTEFEVQTIAYSILRKQLYPKFIVRGEYFFPREKDDPQYPLSAKGCQIDICIFSPGVDKTPPKPILLIEVKKGSKSISNTQGIRYSQLLGVPCIYVRGKEDAYNILDLVQPYLVSEVS